MRLWKAANRCEREAAQDRARSGSHQQQTKTRRADAENIPGKDRHELSVRLGTERHEAENGEERYKDRRIPCQIETLNHVARESLLAPRACRSGNPNQKNRKQHDQVPDGCDEKAAFGIDPRNQHAAERGSEEHRSVKNHLIKSDSVREIGTQHQMMQNRLAHGLFKGNKKSRLTRKLLIDAIRGSFPNGP